MSAAVKMTNEELDEIMAQCLCSTKKTAEALFPHRFTHKFSSLHDKIFRALDAKYRKVAICAPRGLGKTSIVALALLAKAILFNEAKYIVYICNNERNAIAQMENLKRALVRNPLVKQRWPEIKSKLTRNQESDFSKTSWIAFGRTMVLPRGAGQEVRGLLFDDSRPDLIIIDDLESRKNIKNPEIRVELKKWFVADVLKCVSRADKNWRIIYIDTMKHADSLLAMLLSDKVKSWYKVTLPICDEHRKSLAPDFMSDAEIASEYEEHEGMNMLDVFYREFMCIPMDPAAAKFRKEYFQYYSEQDLWQRKPDDTGRILHDIRRLISFVILDPAKTVRETNCESAIIGGSLDLITNKIYFRDLEHGHWPPDETYARLVAMADRLRARVIGVEVNSLSLYITQPLENYIREQGKFFEVFELKPLGEKDERIEALIPYYRKLKVYHNENGCCEMLELQLMTGRQSTLKDCADAAAYTIQLMERGNKFFTAPEGSFEEAGDLEFLDVDDYENAHFDYEGVCP